MKSRTENMQIDIDSLSKDLDPSLEIEFLSRIPSMVNFEIKGFDKIKLLRYIVILYSHDSILNLRNPVPLEERKQRALSFAGIESTPQVSTELLGLENDLILKMIQDFLIAQRNFLWTEIVTTEQQYEEAVRLRLQPISRDSKDKEQLDAANKKKLLRVDCKEMKSDIEIFYKQFYTDNNDVKDKVRARATSLELLSKSTLNA